MTWQDKQRWIEKHGDVTTKEEQLFYDSLPPKLKYQCIRQKKIVDRSHIYFLDFYFWESRLCCEIDGLTHLRRKDKDRKRDAYLLSKGIKTLRFTNEQILDDATRKRIIQYLTENYS